MQQKQTYQLMPCDGKEPLSIAPILTKNGQQHSEQHCMKISQP